MHTWGEAASENKIYDKGNESNKVSSLEVDRKLKYFNQNENRL